MRGLRLTWINNIMYPTWDLKRRSFLVKVVWEDDLSFNLSERKIEFRSWDVLYKMLGAPFEAIQLKYHHSVIIQSSFSHFSLQHEGFWWHRNRHHPVVVVGWQSSYLDLPFGVRFMDDVWGAFEPIFWGSNSTLWKVLECIQYLMCFFSNNWPPAFGFGCFGFRPIGSPKTHPDPRAPQTTNFPWKAESRLGVNLTWQWMDGG